MIAELVDRMASLRDHGHRPVLGITGCPGAGKSTLARRLVREYGARVSRAVHVPMDGFHLADAALDRLGRLDRKGAINTFDGHGYLALLRRLHAEQHNTVYAPGFERTIEQPVAAAIAVAPDVEMVVTEGNYLLAGDEPWPQVRAELSEVWYCDLDPTIRRERLVARHVRFGKSPEQAREWVERVDDPNTRFVEHTRDKADLVVDVQELAL